LGYQNNYVGNLSMRKKLNEQFCKKFWAARLNILQILIV